MGSAVAYKTRGALVSQALRHKDDLWVGHQQPPTMGYRCVGTTGTVRHKAEVQSKSQRGKLFSDISQAPFAVANKVAASAQKSATPQVLQTVDPADDGQQRKVRTKLQMSISRSPLPPVDAPVDAPVHAWVQRQSRYQAPQHQQIMRPVGTEGGAAPCMRDMPRGIQGPAPGS